MENPEISIFPEQTVVYGTFGQRVAATIIDGILLYIVGHIIQAIVGDANIFLQLYRSEPITTEAILGITIPTVIGWLYCSLMESSTFQATLGKQALSLQVTDLNGNRISFLQATGRHFAKLISEITLFIGVLMMLWNNKNQTLHDKLAGTLVVKKQVTL